MPTTVTPSELSIENALGDFLTAILPIGTEVVTAQVNRVPEPTSPDFVLMNAIRRNRFETNIDATEDVVFTGSIGGTALTVSALSGVITLGAPLSAPGIAANTIITAQQSGPAGGAGVYTVNNLQTVAVEPMAAGLRSMEQHTEVTFQLDVHGPNSADNAQRISTLMRDPYALEFFAAYPGIMALYADDARQIPFINDSQAYETRYVLDCCMQANQIVNGVGQQFADTAILTTVEVETLVTLPSLDFSNPDNAMYLPNIP